MNKLPYIFILLVSIKIIFNIIHYYRCKHFLKVYENFIKNPSWSIDESKHEIITLLKNAGVVDASVPYVEPVGYGQMISTTISVWDNISLLREDVAVLITKMIHSAIGVYRNRIFESINPIYWLKAIIYLPKFLFSYLGVAPEAIFIKILQVFWWVFGILITVLWSVFQTDVAEVIRRIYNNLAE